MFDKTAASLILMSALSFGISAQPELRVQIVSRPASATQGASEELSQFSLAPGTGTAWIRTDHEATEEPQRSPVEDGPLDPEITRAILLAMETSDSPTLRELAEMTEGGRVILSLGSGDVSPDGLFVCVDAHMPNPLFGVNAGASEWQSVLAVYEIATHRVWAIAPEEGGEPIATMGSPTWAPQGSTLAFLAGPAAFQFGESPTTPPGVPLAQREDRRGWGLWIWDSVTGESVEVCPRGYCLTYHRPERPVWSHDGTRILFTTATENPWENPGEALIENLHLADLSTGDVRRLIRVNRLTRDFQWLSDDRHILLRSISEVQWDSGEGQCIAVGDPEQQKECWLLDSQTGEHVVFYRPGEQYFPDLTVSPDAQWASFSRWTDHGRPAGRVDIYVVALHSVSSPELVHSVQIPGDTPVLSVEIGWSH
ncbi:PD40 domain-containing protein [Candidatus Sumerlaeota bacterium]|nr:PD40 domain-containing protein [Candidatus Sumerlaeota bacterium]